MTHPSTPGLEEALDRECSMRLNCSPDEIAFMGKSDILILATEVRRWRSLSDTGAEPMAWMCPEGDVFTPQEKGFDGPGSRYTIPLYAAPPAPSIPMQGETPDAEKPSNLDRETLAWLNERAGKLDKTGRLANHAARMFDVARTAKAEIRRLRGLLAAPSDSSKGEAA